jgi:hypothetical protein
MKEFQTRGGPEPEQQVQAWVENSHARGEFRSDVSLEDVTAYVNVIANGIALATSLGLSLDADAMLRLIHHGIDAK